MSSNGCNGFEFNMEDNQLNAYLKLMVLLYADNTVNNLNVFFEYTQQWKLNINYHKTKVLIFAARNTANFEFKLGNNIIEICDEFKYLGVKFSSRRSFHKAIRHNVEHAKKPSIYCINE